jgi:hypothetical protein
LLLACKGRFLLFIIFRWWRRGLLSSIGFLLFIIFNLDDLKVFFRLGFFLRRCGAWISASGVCSFS